MKIKKATINQEEVSKQEKQCMVQRSALHVSHAW